MNVMKTAVFQKDGGWWFKWWNLAGGTALAQDVDSPFRTEVEAKAARRKFEEERKQRYPWEQIEAG